MVYEGHEGAFVAISGSPNGASFSRRVEHSPTEFAVTEPVLVEAVRHRGLSMATVERYLYFFH